MDSVWWMTSLVNDKNAFAETFYSISRMNCPLRFIVEDKNGTLDYVFDRARARVDYPETRSARNKKLFPY